MRHFDLVIAGGAIEQRDSYECLLTGRPCTLQPVVLRKMVLIPPLWIGRKITLNLPFSETPVLAPWQFLRMTRWILALLLGGVTAKLAFSLLRSESLLVYFALFTAALTSLWVVLGFILDRFERVRLKTYNKNQGTLTLRFTSPEVVLRARRLVPLDEQPSPSKTNQSCPDRIM